MKASTVLARVGTHYAPHLSDARRALRQKAIDAAFASPRIWMEKLEPRRLMDATAATVTLDPAFGQAGLANPLPPNRTELHSSYSHLTAAGEGKFYAITYGQWTFPRGHDSFELIRINSNGSLDSTFTPPQIARQNPWYNFYSNQYQPMADSLLVQSILIQPDGKVIVVTRDAPYQSPDPFLVMRFDTDGSPDQSFGTAGVDELPVNPLTAGLPSAWLTADGKIDVMNVPQFNTGDNVRLTLRQINTDGTMDQSLGTNGERSIDIPVDLYSYVSQAGHPEYAWFAQLSAAGPLADGGSIAYLKMEASIDGANPGSSDTRTEVLQVRLDSAGNVRTSPIIHGRDTTLSAGDVISSPGASVVMQADGRGVVLDSGMGLLARFNADGTTDSTYHADIQNLPPPGFADGVETLLPQSDGTILVSITDGKHFYPGIKRLRADGSLDPTFAGGQPVFGFGQNQAVTEAITLSDGSILANVFVPYYQDYWFNIGDATSPSPSLAKILPGGGAPNTFDAQAAEAVAQAAYDLAHPPYVPVTTDLIPPSDGVIPIDITTGDPSTVPTPDGITTDGSSASDISADPLAGAGLTDVNGNSTSGTTGINLFTLNVGSSVFNPDGTKKVFDAGF